ncbi:hypothetical protein CHS0354_013578 [Potamilus streckersoni]|uniref:Uncharacterized protein n=1 Tax=Potamilus streckersoni TaxID=2493646 RepID=A0AAE0SL06_9BIVA|nr:hypothetical protein CHS0354_013578 [Potamilus streckersoni]
MLQDNTRRTDGVAQFQRAILQQDNRLLRFILDQNAVDLKRVDVNEALCICCQQNNIEGVQILLSLKWPLNLQYKDPEGRRALHYAAAVGGVNIIELLLREGIPINIFDNNKDYPIHLAVYNGHIGVIKYLIRKGALVNNSRNQNGETILHSAVERGQVDLVQALVEISLVDVNVETGLGYRNAPSPRPAGYTALHIAVQKCFTDIVKILCVNGANPNKCGSDLKFPIHIAAENGDVEILKILLSAGANESVLEKMENTPLHVAVYSKTPNQVQVVEMLAKLGTGINNYNSQGMAPLHIAACLSIPQVVDTLLQNGSKISLQSRRKGETALVIAASTGHLETINLLLERGSDIRDRDTMGHTVLHKVLSTQSKFLGVFSFCPKM